MMVVNAALFQDTTPASSAGGTKGGGATDPQGGTFARMLSGHATKGANQPDAPGQPATQFKKSSAASRAEAPSGNQAQKGEQREDQVEQSAQEETLLESVKELTAKAQAEQELSGEAAETVPVAGKAGEGNAPVAADNGKAAAPAGKQENPAASEPGGEVKGATTNGGNSGLPQNGPAVAASPAGATMVATLPQQQVVAQNAAQLHGNSSATNGGEKSHAAHHARRKGGEGEAAAGGTEATDGKEQAQQDAPATLAAMLLSGAAMVAAVGNDPGDLDADVGEPAGITAPAAASSAVPQPAAAGVAGGGAAAKAEVPQQLAARGEQSPQLEALQQKALNLAAAGEEVAVPLRPLQQKAEPGQRGGGAAQQTVQSATQAGPAQLISTSAAATPQQAAAPAEKPVAPLSFVATPVAGASFQAASGMATTGDKEPAAGAAQAQVVNAVTATDDKGAVVYQDEGKEPQQAQNAPELSTQQAQTPGSKGRVAASTDPAKTNPMQTEKAAAQEPGKQDTPAVAAERKEPRQTEAGEHAGDGEKIAADPAAVNQKTASTEISGTKTAVTAASQHLSAQGSTGGNGSGDAGEKGRQEQKAQNQAPQSQPATAGMMQFTAARELSQPAATPSSPQSALHESVLSQVKDAVVSHDGKGNGEMSIRLNPGELGELKIQVRMEDNRVRVEVQADNKMVKDLLLSNLDSLKDALSGKNFTMEGFDVSTGSGGGFNSPLPEQREAAQQQAMARSARPAAYSAPEETRVNYMTAEVNNLLDVRF